MTSFGGGAVAAVVAHVDGVGAGREARRSAVRWARLEPALAGFDSPAAVATACRAARGAEQDVLVAALLRQAGGDEWAQLTVLAGLADRLAWVGGGWARAGMPAAVLADAEAELVARCWAGIAARVGDDGPPPGRPGLALVDRAWQAVRTGRRRERRRHDRWHGPWPAEMPAAESEGPAVLEALAVEVSDALRYGRIGLRQARAVYLTRVSGLSTREAGDVLGCAPGSLRVLRARAERRLAA